MFCDVSDVKTFRIDRKKATLGHPHGCRIQHRISALPASSKRYRPHEEPQTEAGRWVSVSPRSLHSINGKGLTIY